MPPKRRGRNQEFRIYWRVKHAKEKSHEKDFVCDDVGIWCRIDFILSFLNGQVEFDGISHQPASNPVLGPLRNPPDSSDLSAASSALFWPQPEVFFNSWIIIFLCRDAVSMFHTGNNSSSAPGHS
jgi:hypothetical protein